MGEAGREGARARGGGGGRGWPGAGRGVRQPGLGLRGLRCGARARAREPARPGAGRGRHATCAATCLRLGGRPADCKARPRGEGGCEETGASAFLEGRLPPRRPRGGRAGGARGPPPSRRSPRGRRGVTSHCRQPRPALGRWEQQRESNEGGLTGGLR